MATLIDGNAVAAQIRIELKEAVSEMQATLNATPGLAVILVGERRDSATYVRSKKRACQEVGITSFCNLLRLSLAMTQMGPLLETQFFIFATVIRKQLLSRAIIKF